MPTIAELKTLYQWEAGTRNMTEFLETTGWWVWSGQPSGLATAWLFYFRFHDGDWSGIDCTTSEGIRAIAVRSRKQKRIISLQGNKRVIVEVMGELSLYMNIR